MAENENATPGTSPPIVKIEIMLHADGQVRVYVSQVKETPPVGEVVLRGMFSMAMDRLASKFMEKEKMRVVLPPPGLSGSSLRMS